MKSKPNAAAIRASRPLSVVPLSADRLAVCNVCGQPSEQLGVWRAHDERDRPVAGTSALVFVGVDHQACRERLDDHPRLFAEESGGPGHFPLLCGPCTHRDGVTCKHPDLKANGGGGLKVDLDGLRAIVCNEQGCFSPIQRAVGCVGLTRDS